MKQEVVMGSQRGSRTVDPIVNKGTLTYSISSLQYTHTSENSEVFFQSGKLEGKGGDAASCEPAPPWSS